MFSVRTKKDSQQRTLEGQIFNKKVTKKRLPTSIAVSLAFIVMVLLAIFSHRAKTGCRVSLGLAAAFLIVTAFQFGLSFNEHLKHEGGKRAQGIEATSEAAAIAAQLAPSQACTRLRFLKP